MAVAPKYRNRPTDLQVYREAVAEGLGPHPYAALLGLRHYDTASLHQRVQDGLMFAAMERLRQTLDLPATVFADAVRIPPRTWQRRKDEGRLHPDESDRVLRFARVVGKALELFEGSLADMVTWLQSAHRALGNARPIDLLQSEPGADEVETLIGRLEHGVFA